MAKKIRMNLGMCIFDRRNISQKKVCRTLNSPPNISFSSMIQNELRRIRRILKSINPKKIDDKKNCQT